MRGNKNAFNANLIHERIVLLKQVHSTVFEEKEEERCDTHFKKICWIDYKDTASSKTIRVCNKKPERVCDLGKQELARNVKQTCRIHYETVCQTSYIEKTVNENRVDCKMVNETMCDENEENCMQYQRRVSFQFAACTSFPISDC